MPEHTATTRHTIELAVTVPGDEGIDPTYLVDVLMWGLEQHNEAVRRTPEDTNEDHVIEPLFMSASEGTGELDDGPWGNDAIQFPRLIAELVATQELPNLEATAESMDLEVAEVVELMDRAQRSWERIKEELA